MNTTKMATPAGVDLSADEWLTVVGHSGTTKPANTDNTNNTSKKGRTLMYTVLTRANGWPQHLINQLIEHTGSLIDTRPDHSNTLVIEGEFDEGEIMQIIGSQFDSHRIASESQLPFKLYVA